MGFSFDSSKVQLELSNCYYAYLEFINSFIWGVFTIEGEFDRQYNKFLQKLEIAGASTVIAEMQKQVDAWIASK